MKGCILNIGLGVLFFWVIFACPNYGSVVHACDLEGYTISTINGIFTDEEGARLNQRTLADKVGTKFDNEIIQYNYLYNPTHMEGVGDLVDALEQGVFEQSKDYDLVEMLNDASDKVKTQKLLLVAHSQGNFYANNFYDAVADKEGGIPKISLGVYGVGSPDDRVAGGGRYLTSDTDSVIAGQVARFISILKPNVHIVLKPKDGNGHSFSDVYLKYQGDRIISDIKLALSKLRKNNVQEANVPCIAPQKLTFVHKIQNVAYVVADPAVWGVRESAELAYKGGELVRDGAAWAGATTGKGLVWFGKTVQKGIYNTGLMVGNATITVSSYTKDKIVGLVASVPQGIILSSTPENGSEKSIANETPKQELTTQADRKKETVAIKDQSENTDIFLLSNDDSTGDNKEEEHKKEKHRGGAGHSDSPESPEAEDPVVPPTDPEKSKEPEEPVVPDTTAPTITLIGENNIEILEGENYDEPGAEAVDEKDGELEVTIVGEVDEGAPGSYTLTYGATDFAGNSASLSRTVNVLPDTELSNSDLNNNLVFDKLEDEVVVSSNISLPAGNYRFKNLIINNNATLTLKGDELLAKDFKGVKIKANNLTVTSGAKISANAEGYKDGPGAPRTEKSGASYGGSDDDNAYIYGSAREPVELGSGGTSNNRGGGAIWLIVKEELKNDGNIFANGSPNSSGGSVYVNTKKLSGGGKFSANGGGIFNGAYLYAPGSGGRTAVYYDEGGDWSGAIEALGGCGSYNGYSQVCAAPGTAGLFDVPNDKLLVSSSWLFQKNDEPFKFKEIFFSGNAKIQFQKEVSVNAEKISIEQTSQVILNTNSTLEAEEEINMSGGSVLTLAQDAEVNTPLLSLLGTASILTAPEVVLDLDISTINLGSGTKISASGKGYLDGPGAPPVDTTAGASYGGHGKGHASGIYGSETEPVDFGSGGINYFRGGGAIRIISDDFTNNGQVMSVGDANSSGGSIYVTAKNIAGNGAFIADGGQSFFGSKVYGPGGGGRIAIHYESNNFSGEARASGHNTTSGNSEAGSVKWIDDTIPVLSKENFILEFQFAGFTTPVVAVINPDTAEITATLPYDADLSALAPTIAFSEKASLSPESNVVQDFSGPVVYLVTAEDGSTKNYKVVVNKEAAPLPPVPDAVPPELTEYLLNDTASDLTADPKTNPISLNLKASENVNWMSIKIENESDSSLYKIFQSGAGCADDTDICAKTWDGALSGAGTTLTEGNYKIKVHIKDAAGNEFYDYLPIKIIVDFP